MNTSKNIIAVGSIAIDTVETPHSFKNNILGGSATYFSVAASLLSYVKIIGVVGDDFPKRGYKVFKNRNINIDNISVIPGKTFRWGGKYNFDYTKRDTLFTDLGVFESFVPCIIKSDCSEPLLYLGNIHPKLQLMVYNMMQDPELVVCDTMNLWIDQYKNCLFQVINKSSVLLINHEEAGQLTGVNDDLTTAAEKLLNGGPSVVIIKMGAEGALVCQPGKNKHIPAYPINNLKDPTGAGDSFAGGFLGYISQSKNIDYIEAVIYGSAMASFCVEGFGLEALLNATLDNLHNRAKIIKSLIVNEDS